MIANLWLLFLAIAKVSLLCGFAPAIAILILYVQVSGRAVSRHSKRKDRASTRGNKPVRNEVVRAA